MMTPEMRRISNTLGSKWRAIRYSGYPVEFLDFNDFRSWLLDNGWDIGKKIDRIDPDGPWSKDNVIIPQTAMAGEYYQTMVKRWEKLMQPLRDRYAPELEAIEARKPKGREFFRYEHPDLEKEGIVWTG